MTGDPTSAECKAGGHRPGVLRRKEGAGGASKPTPTQQGARGSGLLVAPSIKQKGALRYDNLIIAAQQDQAHLCQLFHPLPLQRIAACDLPSYPHNPLRNAPNTPDMGGDRNGIAPLLTSRWSMARHLLVVLV